jgi:hypothetical protein
MLGLNCFVPAHFYPTFWWEGGFTLVSQSSFVQHFSTTPISTMVSSPSRVLPPPPRSSLGEWVESGAAGLAPPWVVGAIRKDTIELSQAPKRMCLRFGDRVL